MANTQIDSVSTQGYILLMWMGLNVPLWRYSHSCPISTHSFHLPWPSSLSPKLRTIHSSLVLYPYWWHKYPSPWVAFTYPPYISLPLRSPSPTPLTCFPWDRDYAILTLLDEGISLPLTATKIANSQWKLTKLVQVKRIPPVQINSSGTMYNVGLKLLSLFINESPKTPKWLPYILIGHCTSLSPWFIKIRQE